MTFLDETQLELVAADYFRALRYAYEPEIAPDGPTPERECNGLVVIVGRLRSALVPKHTAGDLRLDHSESILVGEDG